LTPTELASRNVQRQHDFNADVLAYVDFLNKEVRIHGNTQDPASKYLDPAIPLLGPYFLPPSPSVLSRFHAGFDAKSSSGYFYVKPLTVIHPINLILRL
jgi:hypothetical protein